MLVASAQKVWGDDQVDGSGLSINEVLWSGGQISIVGTIPPGSSQPDQFSKLVAVDEITVNTAGVVTDTTPASLEQVQATVSNRLQSDPIVFNAGGIDEESKATLDDIAEALKTIPDIKIVVVGYTDNSGDPEKNVELSKSRAVLVSTHLLNSGGIPLSSLDTRGEGEKNPIAPNDSEEGREKNRRIELELSVP